MNNNKIDYEELKCELILLTDKYSQVLQHKHKLCQKLNNLNNIEKVEISFYDDKRIKNNHNFIHNMKVVHPFIMFILQELEGIKNDIDSEDSKDTIDMSQDIITKYEEFEKALKVKEIVLLLKEIKKLISTKNAKSFNNYTDDRSEKTKSNKTSSLTFKDQNGKHETYL